MEMTTFTLKIYRVANNLCDHFNDAIEMIHSSVRSRAERVQNHRPKGPKYITAKVSLFSKSIGVIHLDFLKTQLMDKSTEDAQCMVLLLV